MALKPFNAVNPIELGATAADVALLAAGTGERRQIVNLTLSENNGSATTVIDLYDSSDATSANGKIVETVTLSANETKTSKMVGHSLGSGRQLVAVVTTGSITAGWVVAKTTFNSANGNS